MKQKQCYIFLIIFKFNAIIYLNSIKKLNVSNLRYRYIYNQVLDSSPCSILTMTTKPVEIFPNKKKSW